MIGCTRLRKAGEFRPAAVSAFCRPGKDNGQQPLREKLF